MNARPAPSSRIAHIFGSFRTSSGRATSIGSLFAIIIVIPHARDNVGSSSTRSGVRSWLTCAARIFTNVSPTTTANRFYSLLIRWQVDNARLRLSSIYSILHYGFGRIKSTPSWCKVYSHDKAINGNNARANQLVTTPIECTFDENPGWWS